MSETEQRYSQIEKEVLGITWTCEKFSDYVLGKPTRLETDHKPPHAIAQHYKPQQAATQDTAIPFTTNAI